MKNLLIVLSIFPTLTFANTLSCIFKDGGSVKQEMTVEHQINSSHAVTHYETALVKGFIAYSNGHAVVNTVNLETQNVVSFHGALTHADQTLGGNIIAGDTGDWTSVNCTLK